MITLDFPSTSIFIAYISASFLLAVIPGPAVVYVLARTLSDGKIAGFSSVLGVALGNLGNAIGSAIGLAMLFAVSPSAFLIVKYAGAAYLLYLGILAFRSKTSINGKLVPKSIPIVKIFRDGFFVSLLNPKTTLFFAAFLPQFIKTDTSPMLQSMLLAITFVVIAAIVDIVYVTVASLFYQKITQNKKSTALVGKYITAATFFFLAAFAATANL